jgi:CRISPR-associated protein Cmr3
MTASYLQLTAHDSIVARDGRPFGVGQGNRMKGLGWLYPSVVAGSFRTALVKATGGDFTGDTPQRLMRVPVAGVFPVADGLLYLPAPNDCVVEETTREEGENTKLVVHRTAPAAMNPGEGCDWPDQASLRPVLMDSEGDFKAATGPAWWPVGKLAEWLTTGTLDHFNGAFLTAAKSEVRDHVQLEAATGAAAENRLFATAGLSLSHLPRFGTKQGRFANQDYAEITLAARVETDDWNVSTLNILHPLGGERRLVHWQANGNPELWRCPDAVTTALARAGTQKVRMVLATPAVFSHGWRPGWLDDTLNGTPPGSTVRLTLVGVAIPRWTAVSGWSLAEPRGPKPVKRLVAAGGVYFFETKDDSASLAERWLQPVSDDPQDRNDGFGLAVWGTW